MLIDASSATINFKKIRARAFSVSSSGLLCVFNAVIDGKSSSEGTTGGMGLKVQEAELRLVDVTVQNCYTRGAGAAVYLADSAHMIGRRVKFANNIAEGRGGAMYGNSPGIQVQCTDCLFDRNSAGGGVKRKTGHGGGVYCSKGLQMSCVRCRFLSNKARQGNGGAMILLSDNTRAWCIDCEFVANSAGDSMANIAGDTSKTLSKTAGAGGAFNYMCWAFWP